MKSSITDPHHFDADPDADPDPDPACLFDADPDPDPDIRQWSYSGHIRPLKDKKEF